MQAEFIGKSSHQNLWQKFYFLGGNLVCNNKVSIKRSANGVIQVEGTLSEDYFIVRKMVYDNYAIV
jgi:cleavage and polyadenylation specificity factor subunit 2